MSLNGHKDQGKQDCAGCGKPHDGTYLEKFCSESCRWVWAWRRRQGHHNPD